MSTSLFVNEDWSALVPEGSPEARFGIAPQDAKRLGLLPLAAESQEAEPPVVKQLAKPADKAIKKPTNK